MHTESKWQLQEAKNRLSELVRRANRDGAQVITVRGEEVAAIIPIEEYRRLHPRPPSDGSLLELFRGLPSLGDCFSNEEIDDLFRRDPDMGRDVELQ
jgi:prevent-host-death family protein